MSNDTCACSKRSAKEDGFTLIELMIVVAIIGILASIAVPQYQNYMYRARVVEGLTLSATFKNAVVDYYSSNNSFPNDATSVGLVDISSAAGATALESIQLGTAGVITIQFRASLAPAGQNQITLTPVTASGSISWICGGNLSANLKPKSCV